MVTVAPEHAGAFEKILEGCAVYRIGSVIAEPELRIAGVSGGPIAISLSELKKAWQRPLRW